MTTALQMFLDRTRRRPPSDNRPGAGGMFGTSSNVLGSSLQAPTSQAQPLPFTPQWQQTGGGGQGGGNAPGNWGGIDGQQAAPNSFSMPSSLNTASLSSLAHPGVSTAAALALGPVGGLAANAIGSYAQNEQQDAIANTMGYEDTTSLPSTMASNSIFGNFGLGTSAVDQTTQSIDDQLQDLQMAHTQQNLNNQPMSYTSLTGGYGDEWSGGYADVGPGTDGLGGATGMGWSGGFGWGGNSGNMSGVDY